MTKRAKQANIKPELYRKILDAMPVTCVDLVVVSGGKFLLGKRKNRPLKNAWHIPGGRVLKGERLISAVRRKLREETSLSSKEIKFLTVQDVFFPDSAFGPSSHNINIIYTVHVRSVGRTKPDAQHSGLSWFSHIDKKWPKYVREVLKLAGFK